MPEYRVFDPSVASLFQESHSHQGLLSPGDPLPFRFSQLEGRTPALLICDHAGRAVPEKLKGLSLPAHEMERHIAYDIGAAEVTEELARLLDAPAVFSSYSRLVIDPNRRTSVTSSIPPVSDQTSVPANQDLGEEKKQARIDGLFRPYHAAVARLIEAFYARGQRPLLIFVHSFTPVMDGVKRPWEIGILWDSDRRLAVPLIEQLRTKGLTVGDNEPYSGSSPVDFSLHAHGQYRGLAPALIEIRQDLIDRPQGVHHWAELLAEVLAPLIEEVAKGPQSQEL